jgi:hypothetical protein
MKQPAFLLMALNQRWRIVSMQVERARAAVPTGNALDLDAVDRCFDRYIFVNERPHVKTALDIITNVGARRIDQDVAVSWGLVFTAIDRSRILTIYLDDTGRAGLIQGRTVHFEAHELAAHLNLRYAHRLN